MEASRRGTLSEPETKEKVREFCSSLVTEAQFDQLSLAELVRREMCPAWYVASSPVVGRCLPLPTLSNNSDSLVSLCCSPATSAHSLQVLLTAIAAENGLDLNEVGDSLYTFVFTLLTADIQARDRLADVMSVRNVLDNLLSDLTQSWWVICLSLSGEALSLSLSLSVLHQLVPGACVLSFTWIMLMRCVGGAMVWLSLLIIISLLLSAVILSASRLHRVSHSSLPPKVGSQRTVSPPSYNSLSGRPRPYFSCRAGRNKANLVDIDHFVIGDTRLCFACCFCDQTGTRRDQYLSSDNSQLLESLPTNEEGVRVVTFV